jgi:hypothetical protein
MFIASSVFIYVGSLAAIPGFVERRTRIGAFGLGRVRFNQNGGFAGPMALRPIWRVDRGPNQPHHDGNFVLRPIC